MQMSSRRTTPRRPPGRQAATARRTLARSPADRAEEERLAELPQWARTRIAELGAEVDRLSAMARGHADLSKPEA